MASFTEKNHCDRKDWEKNAYIKWLVIPKPFDSCNSFKHRMSVSIQAFRLGLRMEGQGSRPSVISANVALFSQQQFHRSYWRKKSHWRWKRPTLSEACALYGEIDHWVQRSSLCPCELFKTRGKLQQRFVSIASSLHFRYIFVPQNMYHRTKDMHRHAKIGSILINEEHKESK